MSKLTIRFVLRAAIRVAQKQTLIFYNVAFYLVVFL
jgi:hypothetical protein